MNKYINTFATSGDYETYKASSAFTTPNVAYIEDSKEVAYEKKAEKDWSKEYLTFLALEDGTFKFSNMSGTNTGTTSYSLDDGETWTELEKHAPTLDVTAGDKIMFKGTIGSDGGWSPEVSVVSTGRFEAMGNPYSLYYGDDFGADTLSEDKCPDNLFSQCTGLTSAENLSLPATTLTEGCYTNMFQGCTSLTAAPALPAITLASDCYNNMFNGCTSLTTAPALPATTLATHCYTNMFNGCTSLTTAPALPAITLASGCYNSMFNGCTSLTTAPALPATTLPSSCYYNMFNGCTSLTTAPVLPATTLADNCYRSMFQGCTSLNYIKMLATDVSATKCLNNWVNGVSSSGTFVKHPNANLPSGVSGIPEGWTIETATA